MSIAQILSYEVQESTLKTFVNNEFHTFWDQDNNNILASSLAPVLTPVVLNATSYIDTPEIHTVVIGRNATEQGGITVTRDLDCTNHTITSDISTTNYLTANTSIESKGTILAPSISATQELYLDNGNSRNFWANIPTNSISSETAINMYGFGSFQGSQITTSEINKNNDVAQISINNDLDLKNNSLNNVNNINAQSIGATGATFSNNITVSNTLTDALGSIGLAGQFLTSGAGNTGVYWSSVNSDVSLWSNYNAVSTVNLNNNGITGATTIYSDNLQPNYRQTNTYYVSPSGNDNNNGTFEAPFATISKCLQVTEALTAVDNIARTINLSSGNYNENVNINYNVNICGDGRALLSTSISTQIIGNVIINLTSNANSLFQNIVLLDGVLITGSVICFSSADSVLNINNCFIYSPNNTSGRAIYYNPSSNNTRFRLTNSTINSGGSSGLDPLIEITNGGSCGFNQCQITSKGFQNTLKISGTATISSVSMCIFTSDTTSASAPAIVYITTVNSNISTFSNCAFVYSSNTSKTSNTYASGICCESTLGNPTVIATYNTFILQGTNGTNYAIQDLKHTTPTQMNCLYFSNNASLGNAFTIHANNNQNKFSLTPVV